ncbi:DNA mismatch repair protein msh3 [Phlyctochytrium arcticum]|nr:DNA mismatch repair protein msh3 [Phlyctochytrium arcticum]
MSSKRKAGGGGPTSQSPKKIKSQPSQQLTISSFFARKPAPQPDDDHCVPQPDTQINNGFMAEQSHSPGPVIQQETVASLVATPPRTESVSLATSPDGPSEPVIRPRRLKRKAVLDSESENTEDEGQCQEQEPTNTPSSKRLSVRTYRYDGSRKSRDGELAVDGTRVSEDQIARRRRFLEKFTIHERTNRHTLETEDAGDAPNPRLPQGKKKSAYTPLEKQFMEIKSQNPDCLLVVEVGYKFRLFGDDAKVAAKELNIVAYIDRNFCTAGFPTHRLHVHVQKLVHLGYKVGIVRQMETAALKAAGDNKNAPFVRKLTNIYTKGTMVDDMSGPDMVHELRSSYLLCINEEVKQADTVTCSIVAVQLHTGDVIFDQFDDSYMRTELETRLTHIQPTEIILPAQPLSSLTEKLVRHFCDGSRAVGDSIRLERLQDAFVDPSVACKSLSDFFETAPPTLGSDHDEQRASMTVISQTLSLPPGVVICLSALLVYLTRFNLQNVLKLTKFFAPFSSIANMVLNANALKNLEIFKNETDYTEQGSLMWVLDHTKTKFGRRLLRKWVAKPLINAAQLRKRVDTVEEVILEESRGNVCLQRMKSVLCQLPDLERGICRIHYGRVTPSELFNTVTALDKLSSNLSPEMWQSFQSPILLKIFKSCSAIQTTIAKFKHAIHEHAARENDKINLFVSTEPWPEIGQLKRSVTAVEDDLDNHLQQVRTSLKKPHLVYTKVAGVEYLVELPTSQASTAPKNWIKISNTKAAARFHTPFVIEKIKERDQFREQLLGVCEGAFSSFVGEMASHYELLRDGVQSAATIDCLFSLATVASQPGYCKPTFVDTQTIVVEDGRHPMVETFVSNFVPNHIDFSQDQSCLLITGPNMGGKSCYIRQVALTVIMAQIGSYVPATSAELGIFDSVHTRMGASDDLAGGQSTFMKELQETSDIMRVATPQSLVILDELGRGTSTHDGTAIAFATLQYFLEDVGCKTLFVTHYPLLGQLERKFMGQLRNCHMGFYETLDDDSSIKSGIVFAYKLTEGLAHRSYGLNVARLANLPDELIPTAQQKASDLEIKTESRRQILQFGDSILRFRRLVLPL